MAAIERHQFIPDGNCSARLPDRPLPIGHRSTISQPFIVALMTHLAEVAPDHTALEIGTGSGYQAAILARLVKRSAPSRSSRRWRWRPRSAERPRHDNVRVRVGDGYQGWPECGPFDAIIVTAALGHVPPPLVEQLKVGGRLVMPLGPPGEAQDLTLVEKIESGEIGARIVMLVRFVPFVRPPN